jgi:hypothetical protein
MTDANSTEDLEPQIMAVKIINHNDFPIIDRFDGVPYKFESNVALNVPIDAVHHIFGWHPHVDPSEMERHCIKRFGWNTPKMQEEGRGRLFFSKIELQPIRYRMVPIEVDDEGKPLHEPKPRVNKVMAAAAEAAARA